MQHINAEYGVAIGFVVLGNSSVTLLSQGTTGHYYGNQFWDKNAINAYKCISMRDNQIAITYNRVFVVDQSKEDISDCKGLRGVAMATEFWPK